MPLVALRRHQALQKSGNPVLALAYYKQITKVHGSQALKLKDCLVGLVDYLPLLDPRRAIKSLRKITELIPQHAQIPSIAVATYLIAAKQARKFGSHHLPDSTILPDTLSPR